MSIGEKIGVIVLINGYDADPLLYVNQAFTLIAPAIQKAIERPDWSKYVGTYSWKHVDSEILVVNGELVMIVAMRRTRGNLEYDWPPSPRTLSR